MLLAIAEALAADHHLGHQQTARLVDAVIFKANDLRAVGTHLYVLILSRHHQHRLWVEQFQASLTLDALLTSIGDASRDSGLVALTHKARHIRNDHHILLGHSLARQESRLHILRMSHTHEVPGGQTLRQRKLHRHPTLAIRHQAWIEEGRLVQILTHLHR